MKKINVLIVIAALILMFVSLISWILNQQTFAIISSNLGIVILAIMYLWDNRNNFMQ